MRITDVRERTVSLADPMRNAAIGFDDMTASAVAVVTDVVRDGAPVIGYGFSSVGRYGHGGLLRERFIPRLAKADPGTLLDASGNLDPLRAWDVLMRNEKPGGHGERSGAVGVLDMALWDAAAKIAGLPLYRLLSDRFSGGAADDRVFVYASGGHYHPDGDLGRLGEEIRSAFGLGYTTIKIKAGALGIEDDRARVEAALSAIGSAGALAIDVNCALAAEDAVAYAQSMAPYDLAWIEEIGAPLDFDLQAAICAAYDGAVATGENLFSFDDARNLVRYGGLRPDRDWLQFDIPLSYGLVEYVRILEMLEASGWSRRRCLPHAGGLFAFHAAAGLGLGGHETSADMSSVYGGLWDGASIDDGYAGLPELPGIGLEAKSTLYPTLRDLTG